MEIESKQPFDSDQAKQILERRKDIATGVVHSVPTDLRRALAAAPRVEAVWRDLTPTERSFVSWIDLAKESEARGHRIEKSCAMLAAGKRSP